MSRTMEAQTPGRRNQLQTMEVKMEAEETAKIHSIKEFRDAAKAASIIGTLQAGYTNFSVGLVRTLPVMIPIELLTN